MTTSIEYAQMASNAYAVKPEVTSDVNTIPIPNGWVDMKIDGRNNLTGFTARAYKNTTTGEIVVAYTGTTFEGNLVDKTKDWVLANIPAGTGAFLAPQVTDAAKFYLDILNANPGANISFTGHSLGGGLASLMAVFFDRPATVFDEAPFEKTADSLDRVEDLQRALLAQNYTLPAAFANYEAYAFLNENGAFRPSPTREARDDKVTHYYVRDEILSLLQTFGTQAALLGIGLIDAGKLLTLALNVDTIVGKQYYLEGNATNGNSWGWPGFKGNPVDMHAVQLLDAFLMSSAFLKASQTTPELLQALFTSEFNYAQQSTDYNLLSLLVRHQVAGEKPLEALAADISRIRNGLAAPGIGFTLTDLALSLHYAQGRQRESGAESGAFQQVYFPLDGGIQITRNPAHETWTVHSFANLEMWLRGQADLGAYSLAGIERYSLSDGRGMHASTTIDSRNDFMLGADKADVLLGGDGNDLLFGEGGADWLEGGKGYDILSGSWGQDIYRWRTGDGNDKIIDPDGGWLYINDGFTDLNAAGVFTRQGTSNIWTRTLSDNSILTLTHNSPWTLILQDGSTIQLGDAQDDFQDGDFGIHLHDSTKTTHTYSGSAAADFLMNTDLSGWGEIRDAGGIHSYALPGSLNRYDGLGGDDFIQTDFIDDVVEAGDGNDFILAQLGGSDIIRGGAGNDFINIGDPDPNNDGGAAGLSQIPLNNRDFIPLDNRTYADGGDGDDTISVTRTYQILAQALDGPDAGAAFELADIVKDIAVTWSAAYTGWSRGSSYFPMLPGVPAFEFTGYAQNGIALARDGQGRLNGFATFQFPQSVLDSSLLRDTYNSTQFAPLIAYYPSAENDDTSVHTLSGGAGNDFVEGGFGNDFIDGGADDDVLDGERGVDTLLGGSGIDLILAGEGDDWADGGNESDTLIGEAGNDVLFGGGGKDALYGDSPFVTAYLNGDDTLEGGDGDDSLFGGGGGDTLLGGAGDDTLFGNNGNDILIGGAGVDFMDGGAGNDRYVLSPGDGALTNGLADGIDDKSGVNTVEFTSGITVADLTVLWAGGSDLVLQYGANDHVFLTGGLTGSITNLAFASGEQVALRTLLEGTLLKEPLLLGSSASDLLYSSNSGTEGVYQGFFRGYVYGFAGNDTLLGGAGDDKFVGGSGNDLLSGGSGKDTLIGSDGDDTYLFGRNDGDDVIIDTTNADAATSNDTLILGEGILPENVSLFRVNDRNDLVIVIDQGTTQVRLSGYFSSADNQIECIKFDNGAGEIWGAVDIAAQAIDEGERNSMIGTAGNDVHRVDNEYDSITESAAGGVDTVVAKRSYTLPTNVENITLSGPLNISAIGNELDNILIGNDANNILNGGSGTDIAYGGLGDDVYIDVETIVENAGEGVDTWISRRGGTLPDNVENLSMDDGPNTWSSWYGSRAYGNDLDNVLSSSGEGISGDVLDGGAGADTMIAKGSDSIVFHVDNPGDRVVASTSGVGSDRVMSSVSYTLGDYIENLDLVGTSAIDGFGNTLNNVIVGNAGNNQLDGGAGNDTLNGGNGNDTLSGSAGSDTYVFELFRPSGNDIIINNDPDADSVDAIKFDTTPDKLLLTRNRNDLDIKWTNTDIVGAGTSSVSVKDYFIDEGAKRYRLDRMLFSVGSYWNAAQIAQVATDNLLPNFIYGTEAADSDLRGTWRNDVMAAGGGNDAVFGNDGDDIIDAGAGNDSIWGGSGADTLKGGLGDDKYIGVDAADTITENADEGIDTIVADISCELGANIENLALRGMAGTETINGTGNTLNNVLTGNRGDNTLDGGTGADAMAGGAGNDTYVVDNIGDEVTENANEGIDIIQAGISFTLSANVENLTLTGTANLDGIGNTLNNVLSGNAGNNLLDGREGADAMAGGSGDDIYIVDNASDVVAENDGSGTDTVQSSITFTLDANIENLTLTGTADINGTGNSLNNILAGNGGSNTLDGGSGADSMAGGAGNDIYMVDNTGDVAVELVGAGTDTVVSNVTYTLGANVENITLTGMAAINGTGNKLNNILTGNAANNSLSGGNGIDILFGNDGNDWLTGGIGADTLDGGNGTDWASYSGSNQKVMINLALNQASGGHAEGDTLLNIENLRGSNYHDTLVGDAGNNQLRGEGGNDQLDGGTGVDTADYHSDTAGAVVDLAAGTVTDGYGGSDTLLNIENISGSNIGNDSLYGDSGNNSLSGNAGDDMLSGRAGNDWINSGSGNDTLIGGTGNDTLLGALGNDLYLFNRGDGSDKWTDVDTTLGNIDVARFGADIAHDQLWFRRVGNDLEARIIGSNDKTMVKYWYNGSANHIERFEAGDGRVLLDSQVDALVQAMAAFAPPAAGRSTLPARYHDVLAPVLAANWQ